MQSRTNADIYQSGVAMSQTKYILNEKQRHDMTMAVLELDDRMRCLDSPIINENLDILHKIIQNTEIVE